MCSMNATKPKFYECNKTKIFWNYLKRWIKPKIALSESISRDMATFVVLLKNNKKKRIFSLEKFLIHKQKCQDCPQF